MDYFILFVILVVLGEATYLTVKQATAKSAKPHGHRKVYVDTSALIDGRILEVAKTGFLSDDFIIPRSVIRELQLLADGKDPVKRSRARDGMDTASELERIVYFNTEILDDADLERTPVDERLLILAKREKGVILTCDYNLQKVAATEKIEVLNINDLALALGNKFRQGDRIHLKLTDRGNNPGQAVGHLHDGTMVVVDNAEKLIGREVEVDYVRFLQTSSGRMIFAELANQKNSKSLTGRQSSVEKRLGSRSYRSR